MKIILRLALTLTMSLTLMIAGCTKEQPPAPSSSPTVPGFHKIPLAGRGSIDSI